MSPRRLLGEEEVELASRRPHPFALVGMLFPSFAVIVLAVALLEFWHRPPGVVPEVTWSLIGAALLLAGWRVLSFRATELVLTSERLIERRGVLRRASHEVGLGRISSVRTHQSLFERVTKRGTVEITLANDDVPLALHEVRRPAELARAISVAIDQRHSEPVMREQAGGTVRTLLGRLQRLYSEGLITSTELDERRAELEEQE